MLVVVYTCQMTVCLSGECMSVDVSPVNYSDSLKQSQDSFRVPTYSWVDSETFDLRDLSGFTLEFLIGKFCHPLFEICNPADVKFIYLNGDSNPVSCISHCTVA